MFYEFNQTNSGGMFDVDDKLCHRVFIEADSESEAEAKAFPMGIYYNGCATGQDCPCCGDRWGQPKDVSFPYDFDGEIFQDVESYCQMLADRWGWTKPDIRIFYKDGTVKEIYGKRVLD